MVCSRNMASLTKFQIIFAHQKTESERVKIVQNFVRLAIFLEQSTIIIIFISYNAFCVYHFSGFFFAIFLTLNFQHFAGVGSPYTRGDSQEVWWPGKGGTRGSSDSRILSTVPTSTVFSQIEVSFNFTLNSINSW